MLTTQQKKFIELLEEMFQFNQADLDFGIYRIMNQKRDEIRHFLHEELIPQVKKAFEKYRDADIETIKQELTELEQKLSEMGVAKESSEKYRTLKEKLNQGVDITALENEVFSDLTNFFRRYYHNGDFLSLRRYKKDVYAIPYEGEEVKLHWANADQYYVKSSEYFRDYTFTLPSGKKVHFKLVEANIERDNNKTQEGKERRFILFDKEPVVEENGELYIRFEYRQLEGKQTQKKINEETLKKLSAIDGFDSWKQELYTPAPTEKNKDRTLLEKHLNNYTARNTFDYFIHKDLGGFLRRELDFFIKNEIMHLDDIDTENEKRFEQYLSKIKVIKSIGHKIIAFLEQIENFQKKLWLKKKFIVETNYCLTLDKVPEELYPEIIKNKKQIEEWKNLFYIHEIEGDLNSIGFSEPITEEFLKNHPYLVLDTKNFNPEFKYKLLSFFEDLDNEINGILINSDNFHALNLISNKYKQQIKHIYIDPPYNTGSSGFIYKNGYRHSSWNSMMKDRLLLSKNLLDSTGLITVAIDDYEFQALSYIMDNIFGEEQKLGKVVVLHNPGGRHDDKFIATAHEYMLFYGLDVTQTILGNMDLTEDDIKTFKYKDEKGAYRLREFRRSGSNSKREDRPNLFYPIFFNPDTQELSLEEKEGYVKILPIDPKGVERVWRWNPSSFREKMKEDFVVKKGKDGSYSIFVKDRLANKEGKKPKSLWNKSSYSAALGTTLLKNILGKDLFTYPKALELVKDTIKISTDSQSLILDYFAGSGTTGHAVIDLNREDNGNRKYILIEMGEYFDTVLKPRIQKVIYSKDWKDGKPVSRKGSSHIFKYIKLESYEDALNNIQLKRSPQQQIVIDEMMSPEAREEYVLSYMLDIEAKGSASLLNIDAFSNPFDYKMIITHGAESKLTKIDIIETFNYLIGLHVKTIDMIKGIIVITGVLRTGENVLVIWRNTNEVSNEQLEDFFIKQGFNTRDSEFDRIYVNGDNHLENLKLDENKWKVVLIEEEFQRLMFDVRDV